MRTIALFLLAIAAWVLSPTDAEVIQAALPETDIEATRDYIIYNEDRTLVRYDPVMGERRVILDALESNWSTFEVNLDGLVAYADSTDGDAEIYVVDSSLENPIPQLLVERRSTHDRPVGWSRDGRYLAFASELVGNEDDHVWLYVWDGEQSINITPHDLPLVALSYEVTWSYDGRLAFILYEGVDVTLWDTEIYVWDGQKTIGVSRNLERFDRFPEWSIDGQLMFKSDNDILIWDGQSTQYGSADRDTFIHFLPDIAEWYSTADWSSNNGITFILNSAEYNGAQVHLWDANTVTNLVQIPDFNSTNVRWNSNDQYAFWSSVPPYGSNLYVKDLDQNTLLHEPGGTQAAWGANNVLMYCTYGWHLTVWNGNETQVVSSGDPIIATWQKTGQHISCFSG
ncbi:MAG: hypothetical protein KC708_04030 [Anaerolineae bacterium]|nr:hypothetical protein [Anaerolineae bacterium]